MLRIYNTLTRKKEEFIPVHTGKVGMYVCGMTVYSDAHIGHARTYVAFDIIRRYLEWKGYQVTYVQNITDVEDKIIHAAQQENIDPLEYSNKYLQRCLNDLERLGIKPADLYPKASDHIPDIIEMINKILGNDYGYIADGDVYFSVEKFDQYGKLSGQNIHEIKSSGRISPDEKKKNTKDFALWKKNRPGEPYWESPWGKGRPGWHIECSTMSSKYLGLPFDIHGGGLDLMFPHHENEIAQSEAATGKDFARYWMHVGLLKINGEKMSKSLGNIRNINDIITDFEPETLRFFFAQTHYRSAPDYSKKALQQAQESLERIHRVKEILAKKSGLKPGSTEPKKNNDKQYQDIIKKFRESFEHAMDDDFNTPRAIASLFDFIKNTNIHINDITTHQAQDAYDTLMELGGILTLFDTEKKVNASLVNALIDIVTQHGDAIPEKNMEKLMAEVLHIRNKARKKKEWVLADTIREKLENLNLEIQDTETGTTWRLK